MDARRRRYCWCCAADGHGAGGSVKGGEVGTKKIEPRKNQRKKIEPNRAMSIYLDTRGLSGNFFVLLVSTFLRGQKNGPEGAQKGTLQKRREKRGGRGGREQQILRAIETHLHCL